MAQSFLITLREGLEAALIVSIVLAYLSRMNYRQGFSRVWWGVAAAIFFSLAVGAGIFSLGLAFEGRAEELFEGSAMFLAVVVLSWMVVWMRKQARQIRGDLEARVHQAMVTGSSAALVAIAFLAVAREGLETALFMFAANKTSTPMETVVGGLLGLALAISLGVMIYRGSRRINLRIFFNLTGVMLIILAGGLLAQGIHEFQEAGALPIFIEHIWDINPVLNENSGVGSFLKAVFGYNGNPSIIEIVSYVIFLALTFWYFFRVDTPKSRISEEVATSN